MLQTSIVRKPQTAEKRVLENIFHSISIGNHSHSYIIDGGSAAARTECAVKVALALVCTQKNGKEPCETCPQCKKILAREHTDVKFLGGSEGEKADVKVDDVRAIIKEAYVLPTDCDFHIFVFCAAERLNASSQNALLKILEEPPANTVFILLTPSKELLLPTVVSRAQTHTLGKSTAEEMAQGLSAKYPQISPELIKKAAKIQQVFDKIELDDKTIKSLDTAFSLVQSFYIDKQKRLTELMPKNKDEILVCLGVLAVAARDIAVSKRNEQSEIFAFDSRESLENAASGISMKRAMELYESFSHVAERLQNAGNSTSVFDELFARVRK